MKLRYNLVIKSRDTTSTETKKYLRLIVV